MRIVLATLLISLSALSNFAFQADGIDYETAHLSRVATAVRIYEKITIDGQFEEPAWALAIPATDFIQW